MILRVIWWELECASQDRWRPPAATRPHDLAWKGQAESQRRTGISTHAESQAEMGDEEDRAGLGTDEADESRPGIPTNVESQAEDVADLDGLAGRPDEAVQWRDEEDLSGRLPSGPSGGAERTARGATRG